MASPLGVFGENLAADYLQRQGYVVRDRNYRLEHLEIDLVAQIKDNLVLVEVKTRRSNGLIAAVDCLDRRKLQRLKQARRLYALKHKIAAVAIRLDFIAIDLDWENKAKIKHFLDITN